MNGCSRVGFGAALRCDERRGDHVRTGLHRQRARAPRSSTSSPAFVMLTRLALKSASPPIWKQMHALAVDGDLDLVLVLEAAHDAEVGAEQLDRRAMYSPSSGSVTCARMPPTVPSGRPSMCASCDASCRMRNVSLAGPMSGIADRQRADLARRVQVALEQHRRDTRARRRCCRSRTPNRRAAAASPDRRRARADRGSRWRTRRGSADGAAAGPGFGVSRGRAIERGRRATRRARARVACVGPRRALRRHHADAHLADDLFPDRPRRRARSARSIVSSARPAGLRALVVAGDAVFVDERPIFGRESDRFDRLSCRDPPRTRRQTGGDDDHRQYNGDFQHDPVSPRDESSMPWWLCPFALNGPRLGRLPTRFRVSAVV